MTMLPPSSFCSRAGPRHSWKAVPHWASTAEVITIPYPRNGSLKLTETLPQATSRLAETPAAIYMSRPATLPSTCTIQ